MLPGRYARRRAGALGVLALLVVLVAVAGGRHRSAGAPGAHHARSGVQIPRGALRLAREDRAVASVLAYTSYVSQGSARHRVVALTFDDGPGPFTPQLLAELRRLHVPATFFVVGRSLHDFGTTLPTELQGDFVVGDHTENHPLLSRLPFAVQSREILGQAQDIQSYEAPFPHLFRPPYGGFGPGTLDLLHRYGMLMVLWSVDTRDYTLPGVPIIVQRALAGARPGAILLMHDAGGPRSQTVAAVPEIVAGLRRRHLRPVTVPQLLLDNPPPPGQPPPHSLAGPAG